jgi:hypothetical protein
MIPDSHHRSQIPALSLIATIAPPATASVRPNTPTHTELQLTLVRLVEQNTDFVITLNVPYVPRENGTVYGTADSRRLEVAQKMNEICKNITASLDIKDWALFGA